MAANIDMCSYCDDCFSGKQKCYYEKIKKKLIFKYILTNYKPIILYNGFVWIMTNQLINDNTYDSVNEIYNGRES